jgi:hypothetical protein
MWPSNTNSADAGTCKSLPRHCASSVRDPRNKPAKAYSDKRVRHRRHRAPESSPDQRPAPRRWGTARRAGQLPLAEIQRPAPMRQPAHDHFIAADHLLPVNAEILTRLVRAASGHHQPQVISGPGILRPAGLDGQRDQIHLTELRSRSWHGGRPIFFGGHVQMPF